MCVYIAGGNKTSALRECRSPARLLIIPTLPRSASRRVSMVIQIIPKMLSVVPCSLSLFLITFNQIHS